MEDLNTGLVTQKDTGASDATTRVRDEAYTLLARTTIPCAVVPQEPGKFRRVDWRLRMRANKNTVTFVLL
jgi:hypothetical protein